MVPSLALKEPAGQAVQTVFEVREQARDLKVPGGHFEIQGKQAEVIPEPSVEYD